MLTLAHIVLHVSDADRASRFWSHALGYQPRPDRPWELEPPDGRGPVLVLDEDDRTHLDLLVASGTERDGEVDRLLALGAQRADWDHPPDADFTVLADPEGNLFCVGDAK